MNQHNKKKDINTLLWMANLEIPEYKHKKLVCKYSGKPPGWFTGSCCWRHRLNGGIS